MRRTQREGRHRQAVGRAALPRCAQAAGHAMPPQLCPHALLSAVSSRPRRCAPAGQLPATASKSSCRSVGVAINIPELPINRLGMSQQQQAAAGARAAEVAGEAPAGPASGRASLACCLLLSRPYFSSCRAPAGGRVTPPFLRSNPPSLCFSSPLPTHHALLLPPFSPAGLQLGVVQGALVQEAGGAGGGDCRGRIHRHLVPARL